jgi:hypothetical protein
VRDNHCDCTSVTTDVYRPYTDGDFVKIIVGPKHFYAHRTILAKSPELELKPFSKLWGDKANDTVTLPNIDENTAHTLIHYLYSEKYETLKLSDKGVADSAASGYRHGTCVYCSAIKYRLPGLADLAQEKIVAYGKDMNIVKILNVAREHAFPLLPDDETWFPTYLESAIRAALLQDPALIGSFAGLMGGNSDSDNKFRAVVLKALVPPQPTPTLLSQAETGVSTPVTEEQTKAVSEDGNEPSQQEVAEEPQVINDIPQESELEQAPVAEPDPVEIVPENNLTESEDLKLEEINPTQSAPAQPEPYTDEVGFGASKHYKSQAKKPDTVVEKEPVPESKIERPGHVRMDSAVQDTEPVELKQSPAAEVTNAPSDLAEEKAPVIVDGTNGATASKKKRNKKKKNNA